MKVKINQQNLLWYFILIPFLYPRGFNEYFPVYKQMITLWLYMAIGVIIFYFLFKISRDKLNIKYSIFGISLYFGVMLIETLFLQGGVTEGLQKMFATPALFIFFFIAFKNKTREIITTISNILLFNYFFNCTVFCPPLIEQMIGESLYHINFIGHVQISSQVGVLGIAMAWLLYKYDCKKKAKILIILSYFTMFISGTIASYICCGTITVAYLLSKCRKVTIILSSVSPKIIFTVGTLLQTLIIPIILYYKIDFGARYFIWEDALNHLSDHCIIGFGVYGILIKTFWTEWNGGVGMNYAHNEIMQLLLDGGIVLLCCYFVMCMGLLQRYHTKIDPKTKFWFNCFLILYMVIGIPDSITEYNYFYIFLLLINFLPEIYSIYDNKKVS